MLKLIQNFKKQSNLWMFGAFIFLFYGATKPLQPAGVIDHFKVGDVVYSVLDEAKFTQLHGSGWVMLDGRSIPANKDLRKTFGWTSVPDGRGVFIRSMNDGRDKSSGAPDAPGNRPIGSYQKDAIKKHNHPMPWFTGRPGSYGNGGPLKIGDAITRTSLNDDGNEFETRPRNIALYIYIKIHEE
jgi:hypothetical protein